MFKFFKKYLTSPQDDSKYSDILIMYRDDDTDLTEEYLTYLKKKGITLPALQEVQKEYLENIEDYDYLLDEKDTVSVYFSFCPECERAVASLVNYVDMFCECKTHVEHLELKYPTSLENPIIELSTCDQCECAWNLITPCGTNLVDDLVYCYECGSVGETITYRIAPIQELEVAHKDGYNAVEVIPPLD